MTTTRIYEVCEKESGITVGMVEASQKGTALRHVAQKTFTASPIGAARALALSKTFTVEVAGAEPGTPE